MSKLLVLALIVAFSMASFFYSSLPTIIKLDSTITYQKIDGWEATAQAGQESLANLFPLYKDDLFDQAVNDLGINRLRVEIPSGAENPVDYYGSEGEGGAKYNIVNDNSDPFVINPNGFHFRSFDETLSKVVIPIEKRLKRRHEKLHLNITYVDFGKSSFEHKDNPEEYAEFVLAVYQNVFNRLNRAPDSWEIILEPDVASWSALEIGSAVMAAAQRLITNGFHPNFILPSTTDMRRAASYFDQIIAIPGIQPFLYEFAYHRYRGVSKKTLRAIRNRSNQWQVSTAMLEHIGSGYEDLHQDLKLGNVSAWQQYVLAFNGTNDQGGKYFLIDTSRPNHPKIIPSVRVKFFRQYFRFVRSGAIRIRAKSSNSRFDPLAFINKNGRYVVVLSAKAAGSFSIEGLPPRNYGLVYSTSNQSAVSLSDVRLIKGDRLSGSIPDRGVITIYGK
jgi:hypothetical protein